MIYDIVLCVHPKDAGIAVYAINALNNFINSRKYFLITKQDTFGEIRKKTLSEIPLYFLDEDKLTKDLNRKKVSDILKNKLGFECNPSWYFQQFLKMAVAQLPDIADHYLIWDSDTIPLRPLSFFDDDGAILFNPQIENHRPYFEWIEDVLKIQKQVHYSFIDQHFMINKAFMNELINVLKEIAPDNKTWFWQIIDSIKKDNVTNSGFSEFETYGNFVMWRYPGSYKPRLLRTSRSGTNRFSLSPSKYDFFKLMSEGKDICTFEKGQQYSVLRVKIHKIKARMHYFKCKRKGLDNKRFKYAEIIKG